ncbi:hypothetical protein GCM10009749_04740 [Agromyces neolithicus]|uniref:AAA domain-containing protein n=2 Tax=Agromyces neolithicus TaxID=269420 RepID=A0ABN2LWF4_9MICO
MAPGGGRGWFHRKRAQPTEPSLPTPEPSGVIEQPSNLDAAVTATPPSPPNTFIAPAQNSQAAPASTAPAPAEQAFSPRRDPEPPPVVASDSESNQTSAVSTAGDRRAEPDARRSRDEHAAQPVGGSAEAQGARPSAGIDWDAETAAALSGDGEVVSRPSGQGAIDGHAAPDQLLEDLIREIVGDAAVDTASSLNAPRPTSHEDEARVAHSPNAEAVDVEHSRNESTQTSVTHPPQSVAPLESSSSLDYETSEPGARNDTATATVEASQQGSTESLAHPAEVATATRTPSEAPAPAPAPVLTPTTAVSHPSPTPDSTEFTQAAEATQGQARTTINVSRETLPDHGGTPLAYELADETRRRMALEEEVLPLPRATRILTISNQKGGVGKTTTAVNLAAALARSGARVLVIDLDPQGNASTALGVDHRSDQKSVYDVLVADRSLDEVVKPSTEHERLDCVPATIHLAGAEIELVSLVAREQRLRRALDAHLAAMDHPYDYVFIDCPPSLGLLTINAFVAAREVLIPIQCEYYALEGLSQLLSNIELIEKHLNPDLRLSTILLTMYDSRTNLAQQVAQEVRDHFPTQTLSTIIPRSVRVSEAPSYGQSVISYDYASSGSLSYREAAAEIARRGAAEPQESN